MRATNAHEQNTKLTKEELLCWVGLLFIASNVRGPRTSLWLPPRVKWYPHPPLADAMPRRRFDAIASALRLADSPRPTYTDPYFDVHSVIENVNELTTVYSPSGTVYRIDESMFTFNNSWRASRQAC